MPTKDEERVILKVNYWKKGDDELNELLLERGIPFQRPDVERKKIIQALTAWDQIESGEIDEAMVVDESEVPRYVGKFQDHFKQDQCKMVEVKFQSRTETDPPYIFVGLNGKGFYFPKETWLEIPQVLLNIINDAVETRVETKWDYTQGKKVSTVREILRHPYTIRN